MDNSAIQQEMVEHFASVSPEELNLEQLAYAVIFALTYMEYYDVPDDDDENNIDDEISEDEDDIDEDDEDDGNEDDLNERVYSAFHLFWHERLELFQFELWKRGWEALRIALYEGIYIPGLQRRGYPQPVDILVQEYCSRCSTDALYEIIDVLASFENKQAYDAAEPFVKELQKRLN